MPIQEVPGSAKVLSVSTPFLPTSIAGCQLWMDAADSSSASMTLSGSTVTVWKDKSGNGNTTTARSGTSTLVSSAINGLSAISMAGGYFTGPFATANTGTQVHAFAVISIDSSSGVWPRPLSLGRPGVHDFNDSTTTFAIIRYSGGQAVAIGRNSQYLNVGFPNYSTPFLVQSSHNGATEYISVNGTLTPSSLNTGQTGTFNITSYGLGINTNTSDYFVWNGYYAEVIYYNVELSLANRQAVEGYLAQKWGLTASLPSGHPALTNNYLTVVTGVPPFAITSVPRSNPIFTIIEQPIVQPTVLTTTTFTATGANQTFSVPATTSSINVFMWGAAGGGGYNGNGNSAKAGAGAYVQGTLAVTPGTIITIIVGKGGISGSTVVTYGGGGKGISGNTCGSGGGRSAIQFTAGTDIVTVAGGGGAGYYGTNGTGGAGDATTGTGTAGSAAAGGNAVYGGKGGTQSAGGAAGTDVHSGAPTAGSLYQGGNGSTYAGSGGGGGYYGGGGGGAGEPIGGGGGGGSSLTTALTNFVGYNSSDGFSTPYTGTYNPSSIYGAAGGPGSTGGDGLVVLVYYR